MRAKWVFLLLIVCLLFLLPATGAAQDKSYRAESFNVAVQIEEDGSLLVREEIVFSFSGEPFTFVFRELLTEQTDGIEIVDVAIDGRSLSPGTGPNQYELERNGDVNVTWHMAPTTNSSHTFTLTYRMVGVVRQTNEADLLRYQPLPDEFEYSIERSSVTLTVPATAMRSGEPQVTVGAAEVGVDGRVITLVANNIPPNETLVVEIPFAPGSLISNPPAWQVQRQAQNKLVPFWIAASLLVLGGGVFGAVILTRRNQPPKTNRDGVVYEPPNEFSPAIAGAINAPGAGASWSNALAALFDLADRGMLEIEQINEKKWYRSQDFLIRRLPHSQQLREHEAGLLDLLFAEKKGTEDEVKLSALSSLITGKQWKKFTEPLTEEIKTHGLISRQREQQRQYIMAGSIIALVPLLILLVLVPLLLADRFGAWPMLPVLAVLLALVTLLALSSNMSILTDEGQRLADEWQQFYNYLKQITKGKTTVIHENTFNRFLPYAASYGLLADWAKRFEDDESVQLPAYFHTLPGAEVNGMAAFVAMTAVTSSAGGSAAGAAGAGAAGAGPFLLATCPAGTGWRLATGRWHACWP